PQPRLRERARAACGRGGVGRGRDVRLPDRPRRRLAEEAVRAAWLRDGRPLLQVLHLTAQSRSQLISISAWQVSMPGPPSAHSEPPSPSSTSSSPPPYSWSSLAPPWRLSSPPVFDVWSPMYQL